MSEPTSAPDRGGRHGVSWTHEEDAQLIHEIRAGQDAHSMASVHARSVSAITTRAARMIPQQEDIHRDGAVAWLHHQLSTDPDYDWHAVLTEWKQKRASRSDSTTTRSTQADVQPAERNQDPASTGSPRQPLPEPVASVPPHHVLDTWQNITGRSLSAEHCAEFLQRPAAQVLAGYAETVLSQAGQRLWKRARQLWLDEWVMECQWPGLANLTVTATEIADGRPEVGVTLHELVSAAVAETPGDRDHLVLTRRLGLATAAPETLQSVGADLEISRERVRQLQKRALAQLARRPRSVHRAREHAQTVLSGLMEDPSVPGGRAVLLLELADAALPRVAYALSVDVLARLAGYSSHDRRRHLHAEVITLSRTRRRNAEVQERRQRAQDKIEGIVNRLFHDAEWPTQGPSASETPTGFYRLREHADQDSNDDRRWYSPKLDRAVSYESSKELALIRLLDQSERITDFCEQPLALDYTLNGRQHTYYPDLLAYTRDDLSVLIEVKGSLTEAALWVNRAKFAAARRTCRSRGWAFLVTDGTRPLRHLLDRIVDPAVEELLRNQLEQHQLYWPDILRLRKTLNIPNSDIAVLALHNGWHLQLNPWRLTPSPQPLQHPETSALNTG